MPRSERQSVRRDGGHADTEAAAQVAVIACASAESPSHSQLVDAATRRGSPSGSARRYSSEKVELPPHSSQANIPSSSAPPPTYIRSCHASSSDEYQSVVGTFVPAAAGAVAHAASL